jgi:hypothetical protein
MAEALETLLTNSRTIKDSLDRSINRMNFELWNQLIELYERQMLRLWSHGVPIDVQAAAFEEAMRRVMKSRQLYVVNASPGPVNHWPIRNRRAPVAPGQTDDDVFIVLLGLLVRFLK